MNRHWRTFLVMCEIVGATHLQLAYKWAAGGGGRCEGGGWSGRVGGVLGGPAAPLYRIDKWIQLSFVMWWQE